MPPGRLLEVSITVCSVWRSCLRVLSVTGLMLTACSSGAPRSRTADTTVSTQVLSVPTNRSSTGPLDTRPTKALDAGSCPILVTQTAADAVGMRLDRVQVLRQGSKTIGCRFYALQGSPLSTSEHLPGPNQPVVEIASAVYATATAAHNALARLAVAGTDAEQRMVSTAVVGVVFRTRFDPADGAQDWAIGFTKASTLVVIKTAVTVTSEDALTLAQAVISEF